MMKNVQKRWLLLLWLVVIPFFSNAQSMTAQIKGAVVSMKGEELPGVTITMQQTGVATKDFTTTNEKGLFTIGNLAIGKIYDFSFSSVGFDTYFLKDFKINQQDNNSMIIRLTESATSLDQVLVVGYGTQSKRNVTGSISRVASKELATYSGSSFASQLSGKAAGVIINDYSAQPGSDPQIIIRGVGTLTAGRDPLIVVDGFPMTEGTSFNSINPNDIETIDILKDPASAAIYGSRAANGVILITTKKGKNESMKVSLDIFAGVQQRADKVEYVDAYDAAQYFTEARDYGYVSKNPSKRRITDDVATRKANGASLRELRLNYLQPYLDKKPGLTNTNWLDETFRKAAMSSYNVSVSGGTTKTNYYFSANYFNQQGLVINNGLKRYSGTIKINSEVSDRLSFSFNLNPSYSVQNYFNNDDNNSSFDPIAATGISYPFFSVYNPDGSFAISQQIIANTPEDGALAENAVALAKKIKNVRNNFRTLGNTYFEFKILDGLKFKTLWGADYRTNYFSYFNPSDVGAYRTPAPKPAEASETNGSAINYLIENTLTYSKAFGEHDINVLAGYSFQKQTNSNTAVTGTGIADDNITNIGGASAFAVNTDKYAWAQVSYLSRIQYAYKGTYLFSAAMRRDGSSRFGADNKWGFFPSFTAGWILSKEAFMPKTDLLTFAKLRATWGKAGNNQIGPYDSKALVSGGSAYNYVYGNTLGSGFAASKTPNTRLGWETKTSVNFGVDLSFFNRLNVTVDYYNSTTSDLLLDVPVPEQSGFSSSIQNIGKVRNSGLELEFSGNINLGKVKWNASANMAANKNKVLALAPGQTQIISGNESNFYTKVGGPVAELYGYNVTGIYKTQDAIDNSAHLAGTVVGDYVVTDTNGDGIVNSLDMTAQGSYFPKLTYGLTNDFSYMGFGLNFSLTGVSGRKIFDRQLSSQNESGEGFSVPTKYYFEHRYHPENNPDGFFGQPNMGNFSTARKSARASNLYYQNGDYIRIRSIQLSYTIKPSVLSMLKISAARVYVSANNLLTITKYRGFNPDATTGSVLTSGQAVSNYPVARSYQIGVNVTF
ncbi:TonB-dependent receptor [Dyadobacter sp. 3J3]|uniref:SusC/RagA family TonB-linked outer membrane protein n=1 Tax=Dyadobacter sp. 3J3 TaxID=2606600 RepID=UPI0013568CDF|nr:TonB-dependent receptor [Dyadobacter sp. 3J3]